MTVKSKYGSSFRAMLVEPVHPGSDVPEDWYRRVFGHVLPQTSEGVAREDEWTGVETTNDGINEKTATALNRKPD